MHAHVYVCVHACGNVCVCVCVHACGNVCVCAHLPLQFVSVISISCWFLQLT